MIFASTVLIATLMSMVGLAAAVPAGTVADTASARLVRKSTLAAPFGINLGSDTENDVAWVDGVIQCDNVIIGPVRFASSFVLPTVG